MDLDSSENAMDLDSASQPPPQTSMDILKSFSSMELKMSPDDSGCLVGHTGPIVDPETDLIMFDDDDPIKPDKKYMKPRSVTAKAKSYKSLSNNEYRGLFNVDKQARLAELVYRRTATRLGLDEILGVDSCPDNIVGDDITWITPNKLEFPMNMSIPCMIRSGCGGEPVIGSLEAQVDRFQFSAYNNSSFMMDTIMFNSNNIRLAFVRYGNENKTPLVHLHLYNPIMVGTEMTKDIQFHIMVQQTFDGPVHDSVNLEEERQKSINDINKALKTFVHQVDCIWNRMVHLTYEEWKRGFKEEKRKSMGSNKERETVAYQYERLFERRMLTFRIGGIFNDGFYGEVVLKEEHFHFLFVFTFFGLLQLENPPFLVIELIDIEIVNLMQLGSGLETTTINMTIVFKDFERDVLQITSIPSKEFMAIKMYLNRGNVKYYETNLIQDWDSQLKGIRNDPMMFLKRGGWEFLNSTGVPQLWASPSYPSNSSESFGWELGDDNSGGDLDLDDNSGRDSDLDDVVRQCYGCLGDYSDGDSDPDLVSEAGEYVI